MARESEALLRYALPEFAGDGVELFVVRTKARLCGEVWHGQAVLASFCRPRAQRLQLSQLLECFDEAVCERHVVCGEGWQERAGSLLMATGPCDLLALAVGDGPVPEGIGRFVSAAGGLAVTIQAVSPGVAVTPHVLWCHTSSFAARARDAFVAMASPMAPSILAGIDFEMMGEFLGSANEPAVIVRAQWHMDAETLEMDGPDRDHLLESRANFVFFETAPVSLTLLRAVIRSVTAASSATELLISSTHRFLRPCGGTGRFIPITIICSPLLV
jgi:hypothetical protein